MKRLLKNPFQPSLSAALSMPHEQHSNGNVKKNDELAGRVGKSKREIMDLMKILSTF
ncbi:hypothetical protein [Chryseolinea lacunae]|uniref:Uncharacterized protein n=1 Tax=Chryseolinea lacunae TaxID=2801331 RepID=A0ABS1KZZ6_9BACT|nr:hypothetical protein [Chryseolinea lacunae]MBL0744822.1 hypothetical protein [Chryseolinea lacunae]